MLNFSNNARIIVSDTSPFISIERSKIGFQFLKELYEFVIIPPQVLDELSQGVFFDYLKHYNLQKFVIVEHINLPFAPLLNNLDPGEKYAIALALKYNTPILIEERKGRAVARKMGLKISGVAGQVKKAYLNNILSQKEAVKNLKELYSTRRIPTNTYNELLSFINQTKL